MHDLTKEYRQYRECARTVWNLFYIYCNDGAYSFTDVDTMLFQTMVQSMMATYEKPSALGDEEYHAALKILPALDYKKLDVLSCQSNGETNQWLEYEWNPDRVDLRFVALFDWDRTNLREFQYVETLVVSTQDPRVRVGQRILVPAERVRVVDLS